LASLVGKGLSLDKGGVSGFCRNESELANAMQMNDDYRLSWEIDIRRGIITVEVSANSQGWIGIGWHCYNCPETGMTNADFAIGVFDQLGKASMPIYFLNCFQ
jgi:hypothetical protein